MKTTNPKIQKTNPDYIGKIDKIANAAKRSAFAPDLAEKVSAESGTLASFLGCSRLQAILFSVVFNLNFSRSSVDLEQISTFMNCTPMMVAKHLNDLEFLCERKLLKHDYSNSGSRRKGLNSLDKVSFFVNQNLMPCLIDGVKFVPGSDLAADEIELLSKVSTLMSERGGNIFTWEEMAEEILMLVNNNGHLQFTRSLVACSLDIKSLCLLFALYNEFVTGNEEPNFTDLVGTNFPDFRTQLEVRRAILDGSSDLIRKDLVTLQDGHFRSDRVIKLTERALTFFLQEDGKLFMHKQAKPSRDIILSNEIIKKNLVFNREDEHKLQFLIRTLMPANFNKLVERLRGSGMKTGVSILFHGAPGVGKTECALQIARETGRDIRMVDISSSKSMWFGESEKIVKGIFDQYRRQVEQSKLAPILVFNEADGILSSRKELGNSSLDQTENAIQNILLQEIENLDGILIATTNLKQNLDKAFDRRFLYKIRFEKPTMFSRVKIWKEKISGLSLNTMKELAEKHEFTGGQIDNIARKVLMNNVLSGNTSFEQLVMFCDEEENERQAGRIGYLK